MKLDKRLGMLIVAPAAISLALAGAFLLSVRGESPPTQPIAFSHRLHAEGKQIACVYCHQGVAKSPVAGLPSVEKCLGCHRWIAVENPEVKKLAVAWENREPIPWARVSYVPDHVYFSHVVHVVAGVECRTCHGAPGGSFARLEPGMAWCLDCHRQNGASIDCLTCHK